MILMNTTLGFGIGEDKMPHRKKPCLVIMEGNTLTKYASFNDEASAKLFMKKLGEFVGVKETEDGEA